MPQTWHAPSGENLIIGSLKTAKRVVVNSPQGTGWQSSLWQHSFGYQEGAPAGLTISCATVSKQANVFISTLSGSI
jgi:hypothetical protein